MVLKHTILNACSTRSLRLAPECMLKSRVQPAGYMVRNSSICCRDPYAILEACLAHKAFPHTAVPLCLCSNAEYQPDSAGSRIVAYGEYLDSEISCFRNRGSRWLEVNLRVRKGTILAQVKRPKSEISRCSCEISPLTSVSLGCHTSTQVCYSPLRRVKSEETCRGIA